MIVYFTWTVSPPLPQDYFNNDYTFHLYLARGVSLLPFSATCSMQQRSHMRRYFFAARHWHRWPQLSMLSGVEQADLGLRHQRNISLISQEFDTLAPLA